MYYALSVKIRQDMKHEKHKVRNVVNLSWFRESPHRWPSDSLPFAYAMACVEVVAEKSEKAGEIYHQIIEAWGNPKLRSLGESVIAEIPDSKKEKINQTLIHPESEFLPDPNKPFKQIEDLFADMKQERDLLAGIDEKASTLENQTLEEIHKLVFLIKDFITLGFNRESDIAKGKCRVIPDNNWLLIAVMMRTLFAYPRISLERIKKVYEVRNYKGKVIDFHEELTEKPTSLWHRKMVAGGKALNLKFKNDRVIMEAARHWYQCRVAYSSIDKYLDAEADKGNINLDLKNIQKQIRSCDDAVGYVRRLTKKK